MKNKYSMWPLASIFALALSCGEVSASPVYVDSTGETVIENQIKIMADADGNSIQEGFKITARNTQEPGGVGLGSSLIFEAEDDEGGIGEFARIEASQTNPTTTKQFGQLEFFASDTGAPVSMLTMSNESGVLTSQPFRLNQRSEPSVSSNQGVIWFDQTAGELRFKNDGGSATALGGGTADFSNGGEASGGAARSLGNTDSQDFSLLTNGQSRITIEDDGDVGVGTAAPSTAFEVFRSQSFGTPLFEIDNFNAGTNADSAMRFVAVGQTFTIGIDSTDDSLRISDNGDLSSAYRVVIDSTGNVGLGGETSPSAPLDVNGDVNVDAGGIQSSARIKSTTGGFEMPNGLTIKNMDAGSVSGLNCIPDCSTSVSFNATFQNVPIVITTPIDNNVATTHVVNVTTSGFTFSARSTPFDNSFEGNWMALELATSADPKCLDGIDNDGDGNVDSPADTGCASATSDFEHRPRAFVTSTNYTGDLVTAAGGGLTGIQAADSLCAARAAAAGLTTTGSWISMISDSTTNLSSRVDGNDPITSVGGGNLHIEDSFDLFNGSPISSPINRTEFNGFTTKQVWTGTDNNGGNHTGLSCSNWSSTSGSGTRGFANDEDFWLDFNTDTCNQLKGIYCIEINVNDL